MWSDTPAAPGGETALGNPDAVTPGKRVLLASPRGYCAGVERAVRTVEVALERYGPPVYVRRQIVHNSFVVAELATRGAVLVDELSEVPEGAVVVFSAHGVAPAIREQAADRRLRTIDATCPLVSKVHAEARRLAARDYSILLIGHQGHEEVDGTAGEAPRQVQVVENAGAAADVVVQNPDRVAWLSQTTLSVSETDTVVQALHERFPRLLDPPSDDICYATQNRQVAVREIAPRVDLLLVVGSSNSSNSRRLAEVGLEVGVPRAFLLEDASVLDPDWLGENVSAVGLTSGASVPELLVEQVLGKLREHGFTEVERVQPVREDTVFLLPQEIRG